MIKSIWNLPSINYPTLKENKEYDILIIGGGLTGISLCYYLKNTNYNIGLIEQNKLLNSTTLKTTAKLTYLQKDLLSKISTVYNKDIAKKYLHSQINAIDNIINIIKKENIKCDLEKNESYLFAIDKNNKKKIIKEFDLYRDFNIDAKLVKELPLDLKIDLGIKVSNTYVFHPLKYGYGLLNSLKNKNNIEIYENTRMISYYKNNDSFEINLNNGLKIKCKYLIIANHYPSFLLPYLFPIKTQIKKETVICEKTKDNLKFNAINIDKDIISIRFYKDYIIRVINSDKLNISAINGCKVNKDNDFVYTNYDVTTLDYLPIIGKIDNNMFIATGYNAWGITNSNLAAITISDLIIKNNSDYEKLFKLHRDFSLYKSYNFLSYNLSTVSNLISSKFIARKKSTIKVIEGEKFGVYIDDNNKEHLVKLTCPHMKCSLFFNEKEKTWDCPCHGSRFSIDGDIIRGPSTSCIKKV